jgi:hypothetical protein
MNRHLDRASWIVIFVTLVLFVTAVFVKGFGHDLLLEAGVFLVSVKLILMSYKQSVTNEGLSGRLQELAGLLTRIDARLGASAGSGDAAPAPPEGGAKTQRADRSL